MGISGMEKSQLLPATPVRIYIANEYGGTLFQRMAHTQAGESMVSAIRRNHSLHFQSLKPQERIGDEIVFDTAGSVEAAGDCQ